jgi:predicted phosphodiesterase
MEKFTVLGDIHGLTVWKDVVKKNPTGKIIFLGDYLDPYQNISFEKQQDNLLEIIELKEKNPDRIILLLGNHDCHYFDPNCERSTRYNYSHSNIIKEIFEENKDLFEYNYIHKNYIFSHAGIDEKWMNTHFFDLNNLNEVLISPHIFDVGYMRGGEYRVGGPMWIDIRELTTPLKDYIQVVGHNQVETVTYCDYSNGGKVIYCDCFQYNNSYLNLLI